MRIEPLEVIITYFGILLTFFSFIILVSGKKIRGDNQQQRVKISDKVDISVSSAILLVILGVTVVVTPLALHYWKFDPQDYIRRDKIDSLYSPTVTIHGAVIDGGGFCANLPIEITRKSNDSAKIEIDSTDIQGSFFIKLLNARKNERYKIMWKKAGYIPKCIEFGLNEIPQTITLIKEEGSN